MLQTEIYLENDRKRKQAEQFIKEKFSASHHAEITVNYPEIICVKDNDNIVASVGFRYAKSSLLYLEKYLSVAIENVIAGQLNKKVQRDEIAEIGNFSSINPKATLFLFKKVLGHLSNNAQIYGVTTSIDYLIQLYKKLGMEVFHIRPVHHAHSSEKQNHWGNYYMKKPEVIFGSINQAHQAISKNKS